MRWIQPNVYCHKWEPGDGPAAPQGGDEPGHDGEGTRCHPPPGFLGGGDTVVCAPPPNFGLWSLLLGTGFLYRSRR